MKGWLVGLVYLSLASLGWAFVIETYCKVGIYPLVENVYEDPLAGCIVYSVLIACTILGFVAIGKEEARRKSVMKAR
jgi:hypothetical protein